MARKQEIEVNTRLGRRHIDMEKVIYFPRGLAGFEGMHEFTLLQIRPDAPLLVLQSMNNPALGLLVADPFSFIKDFRIRIGDAEQKLLRLKNERQVAVLVTVSIPTGRPEETALNLTGPICINHEARLGLQVPQADEDLPAQILLSDLRNAVLSPSETPAEGSGEARMENAADCGSDSDTPEASSPSEQSEERTCPENAAAGAPSPGVKKTP